MAGFVLASRPTCLVPDTMIGLVLSGLKSIKRVKIMNNQELIRVFTGTISGASAQLVNGRELHKFLESKQQFSHWMQDRINDYKFMQDIDFIVKDNYIYDETAFGGKRKIVDYHLTIDMAKEISMVERNEKGREARRYFIECEKRLLSQIPENIVLAYEILVENLPYVKPITEAISLTEYEARKSALLQGLQDLNSVKIVLTGEELEAFRK